MTRDEGRDRKTAEVIEPAGPGTPDVPCCVEQQVRERAYEVFLARRSAGLEGDALSDWTAAEAEIRSATAGARG